MRSNAHLEMVVTDAAASDAGVAFNEDGTSLGVPALHVEVALLEAKSLHAQTANSVLGS